MGIRIVENGCLILGVECIKLIGFFVWEKKGGWRKEEGGGEFNYEVERVATKKKIIENQTPLNGNMNNYCSTKE